MACLAYKRGFCLLLCLSDRGFTELLAKFLDFESCLAATSGSCLVPVNGLSASALKASQRALIFSTSSFMACF